MLTRLLSGRNGPANGSPKGDAPFPLKIRLQKKAAGVLFHSFSINRAATSGEDEDLPPCP